ADLMQHPLMKLAGETYGAYSAFGTHARFVRTIDSIYLESRGMGWRLSHAKVDDFYCRFQLLGILLTMRDLVTGPLREGFLESPYPQSIEGHLAAFESTRDRLGREYPRFMKWITGQPKIDWTRRSTNLVLTTLKIDFKLGDNSYT